MKGLQLNDLKEEEIDLYLSKFGFVSYGQYEWTDGYWTIEYIGTDKEPWAWRFDDLSSEDSHSQMIFLREKTTEELIWMVKSLIKSIWKEK